MQMLEGIPRSDRAPSGASVLVDHGNGHVDKAKLPVPTSTCEHICNIFEGGNYSTYAIQDVLQDDCNERFQTDMQLRETVLTLENEHKIWKTELCQLSERVNTVAQFVNNERTKRDLLLLNIEKQVQGMRGLQDGERSAQRQALSMHLAFIQDCMNSVEDTKRSQEALENKYTTDFRSLNEKIDIISAYDAEILQDQLCTFKDSVEEIAMTFRKQSHLMEQMRQTEETNRAETLQRFNGLEALSSAISGRVTAGLDQVLQRYECLAGIVRKFQFDIEGRVHSAPDKILDVESTSTEVVEHTTCDDEVKLQQDVPANQQVWQVTDLEPKWVKCLEHELPQTESEKGSRIAETVVEYDTCGLKSVANIPAHPTTKSHPTSTSSVTSSPTPPQRLRSCPLPLPSSSLKTTWDPPRSPAIPVLFRPAMQAWSVPCVAVKSERGSLQVGQFSPPKPPPRAVFVSSGENPATLPKSFLLSQRRKVATPPRQAR